MSPRAASIAIAVLAGLLGGCNAPPPEAYANLAGGRSAESRAAGADARGESCLVQAARPPALDQPAVSAEEVFCGGWTQPSARIYQLRGASAPADLDRLAAGGVWRRLLEERVTCGQAEPTRLADGSAARLLRCTRRQGGWPHLALVTAGADGPALADGIPSALPVPRRGRRRCRSRWCGSPRAPSAPTTSATMSAP